MKVRDIMNKIIISISPDDSLEDVIDIFSKNSISGAPVVKDKKVVGILSESDIIRELGIKSMALLDSKDGEKLKAFVKDPNLRVAKIMNKTIYLVREDDDITHAVKIMYSKNVNRLPVVDQKGVLSGIITRSDITKIFSKKKSSPEQNISAVLETEIDKLLRIIQEKDSVTVDKLAIELKMKEEKVEEWGKILEEHGLIEIEYSPIGKPIFKKKR
jgi:CBS domain-containing protein